MSETPRTPDSDEQPSEREPQAEGTPAAGDQLRGEDEPETPVAGDPLRRDDEPVNPSAGDPLLRDDEPVTPSAGDPLGRDDAPAAPSAGDPLGRDDAPATPSAEDPLRGDDEPAPATGDPLRRDQAPATPSAGDPLGDGPERPTTGVPVGAGPFATFEDDLRAAYEPEPAQRRLARSKTDRLVGGVAGGLGRHFDVDPLIFRIAFVVLTFAGGFGIFAYLVGLVAMPAEGATAPQRWGLARTVGAGLLAAAALGALLPNWFWGPELPGLLVAGVVIYLLVRVVRDDGGSHLGRMAARIALGIALLSLAVAGFAAAAAGSALGGGILIAGLVIALGVALVGGAFRGGARWLIVPAFVLALPLGVVSAANLELEGDWGERTYRPVSVSRLAGGYEMSVGHMQVDLRQLDLPAGRTELPLRLGVGEIEVAVPAGTCVTYDIDVGAGEVATLDGIADDGLDLDVSGDAAVPAGVPELHVTADLGVGRVAVGPGFALRGDRSFRGRDGDRLNLDLGALDGSSLNTACRVAS